jgi:prepilin peptidase CpaA
MNHWYLLFGCACLATALAGAIDLRTGLIPNALTLPLLAVAMPLHVLTMHTGAPEISTWLWVGDAVVGSLVCALVPLLLWRSGGMGGGDLKLFAALGALLGVRAGLEIQLVAFAVAALLVPAVLAFRGKLLAVARNIGRQLINPFLPAHRRSPIPPELMTEVRFGPAIFAGTALVACARFLR